MVWSQVKVEVGRQYDILTTILTVKQRWVAAFEHLGADTTGRIENLYTQNKGTWKLMISTMKKTNIVKKMILKTKRTSTLLHPRAAVLLQAMNQILMHDI